MSSYKKIDLLYTTKTNNSYVAEVNFVRLALAVSQFFDKMKYTTNRPRSTRKYFSTSSSNNAMPVFMEQLLRIREKFNFLTPWMHNIPKWSDTCLDDMHTVYLRYFLNNFLKLVSAIFYQIFIFSPNHSPLKTMKNVFYFI